MKIVLAAFLTLAFASTPSSMAQPATVKVGGILKERSRELKNQDRTGEEPKTNAPVKPRAVAPAAQPVKVEVAPAAAIKQIQGSLEAIKAKTTATEEQKQRLLESLYSATQGTKPPQNIVTKLAADLAGGWPKQTLNDAEKTALSKNLAVLMNGAKMQPNDFQQIVRETQVIIQYSGMPAGDAQKIIADLKALASEIRK